MSPDKYAEQLSKFLYAKQNINMHNFEGTAYSGSSSHDLVNPKMSLSRKQIKSDSGRKTLKDGFTNPLMNCLERRGLEVSKRPDGGIDVSTKYYDYDKEFTSLEQLKKSVGKDLAENPEYEKPYYG